MNVIIKFKFLVMISPFVCPIVKEKIYIVKNSLFIYSTLKIPRQKFLFVGHFPTWRLTEKCFSRTLLFYVFFAVTLNSKTLYST